MISALKKMFGKKELIKEKPLFYPIVCPFCFSKFNPDQVVFRATHHRDDDENYALEEDEILNKYREKYGLSPVGELEVVINPNSIPEENKEYSGHVLNGITDVHGYHTRKRLCPMCHNELPVPSGKVPSNIISVVGASQVGKSVYLTSLIHTLQNTTAANFDAACMPLNTDISRRFRSKYEEPIFERGTMLEMTQKEVLQEPFIFQFTFKDDRKPPITLVFFDVAGEVTVDDEYFDMYAAHIKNSAGLLFLVDPLQIKTIRERMLISIGSKEGEFAKQYDQPREVILTMYNRFIGHENKGKTDIPTAVVLTKSDMLQYLEEENGEYIKSNSNIFNRFTHKSVLDLDEFENINGEVRRFIEKVDRPFKDAIDVYFTNTAYFAVSALGSNPVNQQVEGVVNPIRVDEPFIWLLHQLEYIDGGVTS